MAGTAGTVEPSPRRRTRTVAIKAPLVAAAPSSTLQLVVAAPTVATPAVRQAQSLRPVALGRPEADKRCPALDIPFPCRIGYIFVHGFPTFNICVLKPLLYPAVENSHTILSPISSITITSTSCAPLMCFSFLYHITYYLDCSVALYAISQ